ncbi:MAG: hypothetical protein M1834_009631 [Cirrosporium novae-zelandiae]|nr:MAG: hypothetical protein M1834_009631 [Cirrosporium novae-zelandiae]
MPPRKRRAHTDNEETQLNVQSTQQQTQPRQRRRRRDSDDEDGAGAGDDMDIDGEEATQGGWDQTVKKMVRLALACEYARMPIKRDAIGQKVLGKEASRQFKHVFEGAQRVLREKFGMEMVELPVRDKITIQERIAAKKNEKASQTTRAWILTSTLPEQYRTNPTIIAPPKVPSAITESTYVALYTFIISLILLNDGSLPEAKLETYLKKTNSEQYTPIDKTDKLLIRLCKEGYIIRIRDTSSGEEKVEYRVGPRGKVEVGAEGVAGFVRKVYCKENEEAAELEKKIQKSLGISDRPSQVNGHNATSTNGREGLSDETPRRRSERGRGNHQAEEDEDEDDEDEDDEDDDGDDGE